MKTKILFKIIFLFLMVSISFAQSQTSQTVKENQFKNVGMLDDIKILIASAQEYYKKPLSQQGGGNKFTGWVIPSDFQTTINGTYTARVEKNRVTIVGKGNKKDQSDFNHMIVVTVDPRIK